MRSARYASMWHPRSAPRADERDAAEPPPAESRHELVLPPPPPAREPDVRRGPWPIVSEPW